MTTHTPTPWNLNPKAVLVIESEGITVASCGNANVIRDQWEANAAFIVRAVNAHDELLRVVKALESWVDANNMPQCQSLMPDKDQSFGEAIKQAIARAAGK